MDSTELLVDLVTHQTIAGAPAPQSRAMQSVVSLMQAAAPHCIVEGDMDGPHPWVLVTNDAPPDAHRLLFACHVDTVPVVSLADWDFDPFGAEIDGGTLRGRGTSDMKAGVVAAIAAALAGFDTGTPIAFLLTSDEETGSQGAIRAKDAVRRQNVGAVIVPEATGNQIHLGHRGALWLDISTKGVAAHGSTPAKGTNAILKLLDVVDRARRELPLASDPFLGEETWNLGVISGGSAPNIVPDSAHATVDHRTVGTGDDLVQWWRAQPEIESVVEAIHLGGVRTDPDEPWIRGLAKQSASGPVTYFTDASVLASAVPGAPVVIWGPGTPALMHAANESVELREVDEAIDAYTAVVKAFGP